MQKKISIEDGDGFYQLKVTYFKYNKYHAH